MRLSLNFVIIFLVIVVIAAVSGCYKEPAKQDTDSPVKAENETGESGGLASQAVQEAQQAFKPGYRYAVDRPSGWFSSGQAADLVLYATGFNESGGPLSLNHPGKVATDGRRLIVSDTWNNRVLIWNDIPTSNNQLPDLVLGQPDFNSNVGRLGADGMNWPMGVSTDGRRLIVADANNDRVLVWNEFPSRNGQPADLVLGASDFDSWPSYADWEGEKNHTDTRNPNKRIYWPWDAWTDGKKVVVTSTTDSTVLIWNAFPAANNQDADIVLGKPDFSSRFADLGASGNVPLVTMMTPRSIASDGKYLAVGMYGGNGAYVWREFPRESGKPADLALYPRREKDEPVDMVAGLSMRDNRLFAASSHHVFVWNTLPYQNGQNPDLKVGVQRTRDEYLAAPDRNIFFSDTFAFPAGVASDGKRLIVADTNFNRVLIFNKIPEKPDAKADVVLGTPEIFLSKRSFGSSPAPFTDGKRLIVGVDGFGAWIYNHIPDENKSKADVVVGKLLGTTVVGGNTISDGTRLIMVHREGSSVFIWNRIPERDNQLPDIVLGKKVVLDDWGRPGAGSAGFNSPSMAATDGRRLIVSDTGNNRVLIWNSMPAKNQTPADLVLGQPDFDSASPGSMLNQLDHPMQVSTDGKRLVVADQSNRRVLVWKSMPGQNGKPADFEIKVINHSKGIADLQPTAQISLLLGVYVYNNSLFVADHNRILVWSRFPESGLDEPDIVLGQPDLISDYRSNSEDRLFMPAFLGFDGSFLWVGEFKFSNRLLRYSVHP